jgi:hypothetical protein
MTPAGGKCFAPGGRTSGLVIVVATTDFEVYHEVVAELRDRDVSFTTVEPGDPLPDQTDVVITAGEDVEASVPVVVADAANARQTVEESLVYVRGGEGRTVVGVDPGTQPGIAVLRGGMLVGAFQVPIERAAEVVREEVAGEEDAVVRIGDGARLEGARIIDDLDDVRVELVDETGTTPFLGPGARGMGDVLAAANIALMAGEEVEGRRIEPTDGELQVIKTRSREASDENRTITEELARKVATGELTLEEALEAHREDGT